MSRGDAPASETTTQELCAWGILEGMWAGHYWDEPTPEERREQAAAQVDAMLAELEKNDAK